MDHRTTSLTRLGERVGVELATDDEQQDQIIDAARRGFVRAFELRSRAPGDRPGRLWLRLTGAAFGAVALAAFGLWLRSSPELQFTSESGEALRLGEPIQAGQKSPIALRFSDGTRLDLQPSSRARVVMAGAAQARVVLESGSAELDVAPHHGREWHFDAGPFDVRVTGTRFTLGFEAAQGALSLRMKEGTVVVFNACTKESRTLRAPDELHWRCQEPDRSTAAAVASAVEGLGVTEALGPDAGGGNAATPRTSASTRPAPVSTTRPALPDWRELAERRQYSAALQAAEAVGFAGLCQSLNARELLLLADTALSAGNVPRCELALKTVRDRFPGTDAAANAAFRLGRLAFERRAAFAEAARWFNDYASERPAGPLIVDALGRTLESHRKAGNSMAARSTAQRYLERFPQGPHAQLAHATLAE